MQNVIRREWLKDDRTIKEVVVVAYAECKVFDGDYRKKRRGHQTQQKPSNGLKRNRNLEWM